MRCALGAERGRIMHGGCQSSTRRISRQTYCALSEESASVTYFTRITGKGAA